MHPESVTIGAALTLAVGVVAFLAKRLFFTSDTERAKSDAAHDKLAEETKEAINKAVTAIDKVATEIRSLVERLSVHSTEIAKLDLRMTRAEGELASLRERLDRQ